MFVFQRLTGVVTYALLLVISCYLIAKSSEDKTRSILRIYIFFLFIISYFYIPTESSDLYRLLIYLRECSSWNVAKLTRNLLTDSTPGATIFFYLIGKTGNEHLLPALSCLITYSFTFSVICDSFDDNHVKSNVRGFIIFVFMSRGLLIHVISGVRNMMSFSIIGWCVYREYYRKKSFLGHLPLYLFASSLHAFGVVLFLYRSVVLLLEKTNSLTHKVFKAIVSISIVVAAWFLGDRFITDSYTKASGYLKDAASGTGYSYIWEGVLSWIALVIMLLLLLSTRESIKAESDSEGSEKDIWVNTKNMYAFVIPLFVFNVIIAAFEFNTFHRLSTFITIMTPIFIAYVYGQYGKNGLLKKQNVYLCVLLLSVISLAISCVRGNLCSFKFFE